MEGWSSFQNNDGPTVRQSSLMFNDHIPSSKLLATNRSPLVPQQNWWAGSLIAPDVSLEWSPLELSMSFKPKRHSCVTFRFRSAPMPSKQLPYLGMIFIPAIYDGFLKQGYPQSSSISMGFSMVFPYKPTILWVPPWPWKPPSMITYDSYDQFGMVQNGVIPLGRPHRCAHVPSRRYIPQFAGCYICG